MPAPEDELRQAADLIDFAVAAGRSKPDWAFPYFLFAKGLAAYRQGQLDSAIALLQGEASVVPGPGPRMVLAMALDRQGRKKEALHTLATAAVAFDWSAAQADNPRTWMCHVLRREAESLILPNLPAFLEGKYQPKDNDERIALLAAGQFMNRTRTLVRLYADAFAADPALADDLVAGHRYNAARAAAQAGAGHGADATDLNEDERRHLREQARQWLRADLEVWTKRMVRDSQAERDLGKKTLTRWQGDPDLAGIREPRALEPFSKDEQEECLALWRDVAAVLKRRQTIK
jgi:serine/threonine-protein kinase